MHLTLKLAPQMWLFFCSRTMLSCHPTYEATWLKMNVIYTFATMVVI